MSFLTGLSHLQETPSWHEPIDKDVNKIMLASIHRKKGRIAMLIRGSNGDTTFPE
jgi:hypothetical protein